jgi:hypothetical protein
MFLTHLAASRGKLHDAATDPGTKCISVRGYYGSQDSAVGPITGAEKRRSYWGTMHVLHNGQAQYNDVAKKSLKVAARIAESAGKSYWYSSYQLPMP